MLKDTTSRDGRCHFQKKELDGENLYDRTERIKKKARGDEIRQLVGEMHCDGIEDKDIAEAVGITTRAVRRHLKMLEMIT